MQLRAAIRRRDAVTAEEGGTTSELEHILGGLPPMGMLNGEEIAAAGLTDWPKLAQGLHSRYLVEDFSAGARFVVAVGEVGDELGHHPRVAIG